MLVPQTLLFKLCPVDVLVNLLEDVFPDTIVALQDGVLGGPGSESGRFRHSLRSIIGLQFWGTYMYIGTFLLTTELARKSALNLGLR